MKISCQNGTENSQFIDNSLKIHRLVILLGPNGRIRVMREGQTRREAGTQSFGPLYV